MDMSRVEFRWAADDINRNANDYWMRVMDIARKFNVPRIKRYCLSHYSNCHSYSIQDVLKLWDAKMRMI